MVCISVCCCWRTVPFDGSRPNARRERRVLPDGGGGDDGCRVSILGDMRHLSRAMFGFNIFFPATGRLLNAAVFHHGATLNVSTSALAGAVHGVNKL